MTNPAQKPRTTSGWSPERRARHAAAIRRWAPWTKSTGPKTARGKARASRNAWKHGRRCAKRRLLQALLTSQRRLHTVTLTHFRRRIPANELLENAMLWFAYALAEATKPLIFMLLESYIMHKPCILGPPEGKS